MQHICENGICHIVREEKKDAAEDKPKIQLNDDERTPCEIWTRVMGYHRPVSQWNKGKKSEYKERQYFKEEVALNSLDNYKRQEAGNE